MLEEVNRLICDALDHRGPGPRAAMGARQPGNPRLASSSGRAVALVNSAGRGYGGRVVDRPQGNRCRVVTAVGAYRHFLCSLAQPSEAAAGLSARFLRKLSL